MHSLRSSLPAKRRQIISLTPLIDVVFILLIFFMLASSFLDWRTITLNTPGQAVATPDMEGAMLVRLRADGTLDLAGEALSGEQLQARLQAALARKPDQRVLVRPERGVVMQRAVAVLDLVAATGIKDVSLVRGR
ncbi:ExbD/TolR family protein [Oceanibaculum nanhaiense]|uniref:ExbD/TolR family protein n=1 Tax=Oceanibaculum nanhaiense TaxID=1909734 RepID=UPI000A3B2F0D|nr:biopolymer transporter ExbD [Oceanibaculum nanhaiense]